MAVRSFGAFVSVLRNALATIQLRPVGDTLHDRVVLGVGIPAFVRKQQLRRQGVAGLSQSLQLVDERGRQRYNSFLPVLRPKVPQRLGGDADLAVPEVK